MMFYILVSLFVTSLVSPRRLFMTKIIVQIVFLICFLLYFIIECILCLKVSNDLR